MSNNINRRSVLQLGVALTLLPSLASAQSNDPIKIGSLTPLTGAGASYGGRMRDAFAAVVNAANEAGGVGGRQIVLVSEDDQTNPDAGVRAARKLIDVDRVVAIAGVWASSVTSAVAPLCWESKTMLLCTSGADSITRLPHKGYIIRTEPSADMWAEKAADFMLGEGAKKIAYLGIQAPFAASMAKIMADKAKQAGGSSITVIYESGKNSYRSEIDQMIAQSPDAVFLGGYSTDTTIVLRDLYRAGYSGKLLSQSYTLDQALLDALPAEITNGVYALGDNAAENSLGYKAAQTLLKTDHVDPYVAQAFDHANLVILALAVAKDKTGEGIHDNIRRISQGSGTKVGSVVDGLKILANGGSVDLDGASGDLTFNDIGDITQSTARFEVIKDKKPQFYKTL